MSGDPIKAFGVVVREARNEQRLSQEELAFESNLDRTFISLLETGKKQPSLLTIFQLATALRISPSDLLKRVEHRLE
ncbi:helix-turn-helix domain-containing protein [Hymenobacter sp. GOD-10R]|uniref:helix-turn-helix domain-containing protein n=1 Tax=Hymenobacter sp. GOD-10R TaxID=3093922 RepID=UPI003A5CD677